MADHIFLLNLSCWHWNFEAVVVAMYSGYQLHALMLVFPCIVVCSRVWEPITVLMIRIRYLSAVETVLWTGFEHRISLFSQDLNLQSCRKWCDLGLFFSAASLDPRGNVGNMDIPIPQHMPVRPSPTQPSLRPDAYCSLPLLALVLPVRIVPAANLICMQTIKGKLLLWS